MGAENTGICQKFISISSRFLLACPACKERAGKRKRK
jgi:hypothetical protein